MGYKARPVEERFWEKVEKRRRNQCWWWTASRNSEGYGTFSLKGSISINAHCFAYILFYGPVPEGLEVHHTCNNGRLGCVNPYHLKAVTHSENVRLQRGDRCKHGHKFTHVKVTARGEYRQRVCATCTGKVKKSWQPLSAWVKGEDSGTSSPGRAQGSSGSQGPE